MFVPSAFVSGVVVWRVASSERSRFGPVAGVAATGLTYLIGSLIAAGVSVIPSVLLDFGQSGLLSVVTDLLVGTVYIALFVGIPVFVFTFWLALPLGALGGSIYERTRTLS